MARQPVIESRLPYIDLESALSGLAGAFRDSISRNAKQLQ